MTDDLLQRANAVIARCHWEGRNQGLPPFDYQTWYADVESCLTDLIAALRAMEENFTAERAENLRLAALLAALLRGDMVEGEA